MTDPVQLWVDALRSGEYQQTTGRLRDDTGYCCLGVACEVYQKHGPNGLTVEKSSPVDYCPTVYTYATPEGEVRSTELPRKVAAWLGLRDESGHYDAEDPDGDIHETSLADQNDSGITFAAIADIIESRPEGLFTYA